MALRRYTNLIIIIIINYQLLYFYSTSSMVQSRKTHQILRQLHQLLRQMLWRQHLCRHLPVLLSVQWQCLLHLLSRLTVPSHGRQRLLPCPLVSVTFVIFTIFTSCFRLFSELFDLGLLREFVFIFLAPLLSCSQRS